ncbi:MAG TPA: hypothetical protein VJ508_19395, partial [Saprospiraceae bacterium]|nr:hypothetical protein [Saprospiraceae bacterium]
NELETYEYARPARSTSRTGYAHEKSVEKDKSILEEIRVKDFFHHLDERLNRYLRPNAPLFVFGTKEILGYYKEMTKHGKRIAGMETGSYGNTGTAQIGMMAWPLMQAFLKRNYAQSIGVFQEKIGVGQGVSGIQSVWNVAHEGRGWRLLMEKDFRCPGFVTLDDQFLHLTAPLQPHRIITDAVQEIMGMVMRKNGEVMMVDNGMLSAFDRIALITRY